MTEVMIIISFNFYRLYFIFSPKCQMDRERPEVMHGDVAEITNIRIVSYIYA